MIVGEGLRDLPVQDMRALAVFNEAGAHTLLTKLVEGLRTQGDETAAVFPSFSGIRNHYSEIATWDWQKQHGSVIWRFRGVEVTASSQGEIDVRFPSDLQAGAKGLVHIVTFAEFISSAPNGRREDFEALEARYGKFNFPFGMSLEEQVLFAKESAVSIIYCRRHEVERGINMELLSKPQDGEIMWG